MLLKFSVLKNIKNFQKIKFSSCQFPKAGYKSIKYIQRVKYFYASLLNFDFGLNPELLFSANVPIYHRSYQLSNKINGQK